MFGAYRAGRVCVLVAGVALWLAAGGALAQEGGNECGGGGEIQAASVDADWLVRGSEEDLKAFWRQATCEEVVAALKGGADVHERDEEWNGTPLHWAAYGSKAAAVVEALLAAGADLTARDERWGGTPLHAAAYWSEAPEVVEALLAAGADLTTRDGKWGGTPLHWAAWGSDSPAVVRVLLDAGADVVARTENGTTPCDVDKDGILEKLGAC